jgi:hypothetical protein
LYDSFKNFFGTVNLANWPTSSGKNGCEQMHEGTVLEMKKKKIILTNKKETRRAIRAAVNQAKKVDDEMERYRDADRLEEAIRIGK